MTDQNYPTKDLMIIGYPPISTWKTIDEMPNKESFIEGILGQQPHGSNKTMLWVHLPFCKSRCNFCWYPTTRYDRSTAEEFMKWMKVDLKRWANADSVRNQEIGILFIAGGTPTILPHDLIEDFCNFLKDHFRITDDTYVTMEATPDSVRKNPEKLSLIKEIVGLDKVRLGVQSFNADLNIRANRSHNPDDAIKAIQLSQEMGISASIDLLYGLLGQNIASWEKNFDIIKEIEPHELTIYQLSYAKPSINLRQTLDKHGSLEDVPSQNEKKKMLYFAIERLKELDYQRTTFFNWVKIRDEMSPKDYLNCHTFFWEHVSVGWHLIGSGPMTFSYLGKYAAHSPMDIEGFLSHVQSSSHPALMLGREVEQAELMRRYIIFFIQLLKVPKANFKELFGMEIHEAFPEKIEELIKAGLFVNEDKHYLPSNVEMKSADLCRQFYSDEVIKSLSGLSDRPKEDFNSKMLRSFV